jgi:hypothetical protein
MRNHSRGVGAIAFTILMVSSLFSGTVVVSTMPTDGVESESAAFSTPDAIVASSSDVVSTLSSDASMDRLLRAERTYSVTNLGESYYNLDGYDQAEISLVRGMTSITAFSEGDGSAGNAYVITTATHLQNVGNNPDASYVLGNDIDASSITNFDPIGDSSNKFTGTFDGSEYTISELTISRDSEDYVGLFGYVNGGTIDNVGVGNVDITGSKHVGGLVGYNQDATVANSYATGSVSGVGNVGGLVGTHDDSDGATTAFEATITNSYATNSVSGTNTVGGLVGLITDGTVTTSYAVGDVTGNSEIGGLIGKTPTSVPVSNAYWDVGRTGQSGSAGGTGLTTAQMTGANALASMTGFDTSVWKENPSTSGFLNYPTLKLNTQSPPPRQPDSNEPPIAPDDSSQSTDEDTVLSISDGDSTNLKELASDPNDGDTLSIAKIDGQSFSANSPVTLNSAAAVTVSSSGSWSYDPNNQYEDLIGGQSITDSFTYTVKDNSGETDTGTITVDVTGVDDTTQFDFSSIFNADVVSGNGSPAGDFDREGGIFVSSSVAKAKGQPSNDGVPDDGIFGATNVHPRIELANFNTANSNAWQVDGLGSVKSPVVNGEYSTVHVIASAGGAGAGNPARFEVIFNYQDGTTANSPEFTVPDWFGTPPDPPGYPLRDGMDRVFGGRYEDSNEPGIFGYAIPMDSAKTLTGVTISVTENQAGSFNFFGGVATQAASNVINLRPTFTQESSGKISVSTSKDQPLDLTSALEVQDISDSDKLTFTVSNAPTNGILSGIANQELSFSGERFHTLSPSPQYNPDTGFAGTDSFDVTVEDETKRTSTATVSVSVTTAPVFSSATTASVTENTAGTVLDVQATDGDGGSADSGIVYSIVGGNDGPKFSINSNTGVLVFNSVPDYETPSDSGSNNNYILNVQADDSTETATQTITVTVTDVNESPIALGGSSQSTGDTDIINIEPRTVAGVTLGNTDGSGTNDTKSVVVREVKLDEWVRIEFSDTPAGIATENGTTNSTDETASSQGDGADVDPSDQELRNVLPSSLDITFKRSGDYAINVTARDVNIFTRQTTESATDEPDTSTPDLSTDALDNDAKRFVGETNQRPIGFIDVETNFDSADAVETATHRFRVRKSYFAATSAAADSVRLYRDEPDGWRSLPTRQTDEDEEFYYFEADTPGFSVFAIGTSSPIFETGTALLNSFDEMTGAVVAQVPVENIGSVPGVFEATLTADGTVVATRTTTIDANETTDLTVAGILNTTGSATLQLAGQSFGTVTRLSEESPASENEDPAEGSAQVDSDPAEGSVQVDSDSGDVVTTDLENESSGLGVPGIGLGLFVALGLLFVFIDLRRRENQEE